MRRKRRARIGLALILGVFLLIGGPADASVTWTLSNYTHSAFSNMTFDNTTGSFIPTDMVIIFPAGWPFAEANDSTSPFGSNSPQNGDIVGTGTITAKWAPFCTTSTMSVTLKWVEPVDSGAPPNTVGEISITTTLFTAKIYILKVNGQYEFDIPSMPTSFICSSTTAGDIVINLNCTISGTTRHLCQNPSTVGTYSITVTWHDTTGTTHTDTASLTIT